MAYILAFSAHSYAFSLAMYPDVQMPNATIEAPMTTPSPPKDDRDLQLAIVITSYISCSLISLGSIIWVVFDSVVSGNIPTPMPLLAKIVAPFCLSSSVRALVGFL